MNASVAIQVLPGVQDEEEVIRIVDEVIDYISPHETVIGNLKSFANAKGLTGIKRVIYFIVKTKII